MNVQPEWSAVGAGGLARTEFWLWLAGWEGWWMCEICRMLVVWRVTFFPPPGWEGGWGRGVGWKAQPFVHCWPFFLQAENWRKQVGGGRGRGWGWLLRMLSWSVCLSSAHREFSSVPGFESRNYPVSKVTSYPVKTKSDYGNYKLRIKYCPWFFFRNHFLSLQKCQQRKIFPSVSRYTNSYISFHYVTQG